MNQIQEWIFEPNEEEYVAMELRSLSAVEYYIENDADDKGNHEWEKNFRSKCLKLAQKIIGKNISGTIVDIGAGTGMYSCILSKNEEVEKIYALDYSRVCVEKLIIHTIDREEFDLSDIQKEKIIPVVGSFNNMKKKDKNNEIDDMAGKMDFVIAMGALHHSLDREETIREIRRVLKEGGYLIACERASFNTKTNQELIDALNEEFTKEFKIRMGYDVNEVITRRMNSEHDPLMAEWEYLLAKCGFQNNIFWFFKSNTSGPIKCIYNGLARLFFKIFGCWLAKKKKTNKNHLKIPYYPWFYKGNVLDDVLIISKKLPYVKMP